MTEDTMSRLVNIWKSHGITTGKKKTKVRLVQALIFLIFLHGIETWIRARGRAKRNEAFEMCWRRILRISWIGARCTNVSILEEDGIRELSTVCLRRIPSYFGHIARRMR